MSYEVIVAGGSVAGLLCAREIAHGGHSVLVIEEDYEIGTPEHCGGLVSITGLEEMGIIPHRKTLGHLIESAEIFSPEGKSFTINSKKQKVTEINRRELDKQIAHQAKKNGAEIKVRTSLQEIFENCVKTSEGTINCKIIVDARGVSSLIQKDRTGVITSAQYEIYGDWIKKGKVEVYFDQEKYPGFFAWIIPSSDGIGKVGVAGRGINATQIIDQFLNKKGGFSTIRKIYSPIWVNGPIKEFVSKNVVTIGDAAGLSKPTTAGGIYSCGMSGIFAGQAISKFLDSGDSDALKEYQKRWKEKFGSEFEKQSLARKILERIDNAAINKLFDSITPEIIKDISEKDDFDFHTTSLVKLFGLRRSLKAAQLILGAEIKSLLPK